MGSHLPAPFLHCLSSFAPLPNAIVSLLYVMEDGATTEIAVIGREGVAGVVLYEAERATCTAIVQTAGYGYRLKTAFLREVFNEGGALAQLLMRYTSAMFAQMAQNVVGGRHCSIEQKLCRWLLDRLDRSLSNELKVTQDTMANMLGVRRESVTVTARKLQDEGLIQYRAPIWSACFASWNWLLCLPASTCSIAAARLNTRISPPTPSFPCCM